MKVSPCIDHSLSPYTCLVHLNTMIRYSSLIRLYDCVLPRLVNDHVLVNNAFPFINLTGWLIKDVFFFISYFICMCLGTCSNSSWQYHLICAMTFKPTHFAMVTISFLSPPSLPPPPRPHPRPLSFVWLAWIKVPMMHGATTSTVSSASTPVTNVPFAESATSNQVCSFISVPFLF